MPLGLSRHETVILSTGHRNRSGTNGLNPLLTLFQPESLTQPQMLLQVQRLGADRSFLRQFRQFAIHFFLAVIVIGHADQRAAQVLAAMNVQIPEKAAEFDLCYLHNLVRF